MYRSYQQTAYDYEEDCVIVRRMGYRRSWVSSHNSGGNVSGQLSVSISQSVVAKPSNRSLVSSIQSERIGVASRPSSQLPLQLKPTVGALPNQSSVSLGKQNLIPTSQFPAQPKPVPKNQPLPKPNPNPVNHPTQPPIPAMKDPTPNQLETAFKLIVEGQTHSHRRVIYFTPNQYGGFSNSFRAIRSLALYSLLYDYKLRVDWNQYYEVMNDSVRALSSHVRRSCRRIRTFDVPFKADGLGVKRCIWTDDIMDVTERMMQRPENGKKLVALGLFNSVPTADEVSHFMSLLLFRLNGALRSEAETAFSRYPHPLLGLQIRTGGSSANTHERVVFFTLDKVNSILSFVDSFVKNNQLSNVTLFLSTDSDEMAHAIRRKSKYSVISLNAYTIGHSSPQRNRNRRSLSGSLKRAVMDIYLLSKCDYLITTRNSSFGRTAHYLSSSTRKQLMETTIK